MFGELKKLAKLIKLTLGKKNSQKIPNSLGIKNNKTFQGKRKKTLPSTKSR
jgi:hypothetical protein